MLGKTEGIILRTHDYGEGNKILSVFTQDMGKVGMMAQGARKTKSRFAAVSQPFTHALFLFHVGSGLASLNQADLIQSFPKIRGDLYRTAYTSYILELTDKLTEERQKYSGLYNLLLESLKQMESGKDSEIIARIFESKILTVHGYKPVFENCASCRQGESPWFFSITEGGLLCDMCRRKDPYSFLLMEGIPRLLSLFQRIDMSQLGKISLKAETRQQLKKVMYLFIDEYLGIRLKSRQFLEQLDKMEQVLPRKENIDGENP
ncbi:DNA repair protein RecO [Ammoniphilus sp. CFH 90114]|uniref:DNA repair protein RecO n=1 Tax=Ammoniphilus sp. CFH 90114 TaxID=2493665 RepID=UPI0013E93C93|nr:DNA repair protein RecO [Ammoniphilus sp. CFH 90114]